MPIPDPADLNALYQEWLEIPADRLPPNHYALLGLYDFESDETLIESAAKSRSAYLHQIAAGPRRKIVQEMLGQVAIARRTLLSGESRSAYDESLRSGAATNATPGASTPVAIEPAAAVASESSQRRESTVPRPRTKASDWKYHGISAAVLLTVVAIVFWVNRNPGGRRAAEARPSQRESPVRESSLTTTATNDVADQDQKSGSGGREGTARRTRKASQQATRSGVSVPRSRSPIAKRRETGSGLGAGLGDKFGEVLSDIAKQPEERAMPSEATPRSPGEFRPLGGLSIGPGKKLTESSEALMSLQGLSPVDAFPAQLADRFESEQGFDWFETTDGELRLKSIKGPQSYQLSDKQFKLTAGSALALTSSLSAGMPGGTQVGFEVDGIRIGLRSVKQGVEVFARDRGEASRRDPVDKLTTSDTTTTLSVWRDAKQPDTLQWFVDSGDRIQTGTIGVTSIGESPTVGIFVSVSKTAAKRPLTLSGLKTRSGQP
ncbi:hypothetical protein Enr13x_40280 [Stieleria neptunia]|uniref:J domain-containing protein n=1 Tax=Stieleria neptunia TaxID=2527979 RepID=A0A518HTK2_9BACT|nr:DUF3681 domain-containing protein [Stieleria neptunia]QDV44166.1 hypothetical protein Enr13x_40280 [Stieleria neptunia]